MILLIIPFLITTTYSTTNFSFSRQILAIEGDPHDGFGRAMAISGNTAVIAASFDNINGSRGQGSAYIYMNNGNIWQPIQEITASNGKAGDAFGVSVAINNDTIFVGSTNYNQTRGTVYIFTRNPSSNLFTQTQQLIMPNALQFGYNIAVTNDTAIISSCGVKCYTYPMNYSSAFFVYTRTNNRWIFRQKLTSNTSQFEFLRETIVLNGNTAFLGGFISTDPTRNIGYGAVFVFMKNGNGIWYQTETLIPNGEMTFMFGYSMDISGNTAIIGSFANNKKADNGTGHVYVFEKNGSIWKQEQMLVPSDVKQSEWFSHALVLNGNEFAAVTYPTLLRFAGKNATGATYVYQRRMVNGKSVWLEKQKLMENGRTVNGIYDNYGISMAFGGGELFVGASSAGNVSQGIVFEYTKQSIVSTTTMQPTNVTSTTTTKPNVTSSTTMKPTSVPTNYKTLAPNTKSNSPKYTLIVSVKTRNHTNVTKQDMLTIFNAISGNAPEKFTLISYSQSKFVNAIVNITYEFTSLESKNVTKFAALLTKPAAILSEIKKENPNTNIILVGSMTVSGGETSSGSTGQEKKRGQIGIVLAVIGTVLCLCMLASFGVYYKQLADVKRNDDYRAMIPPDEEDDSVV